jgi:hypothetical protein
MAETPQASASSVLRAYSLHNPPQGKARIDWGVFLGYPAAKELEEQEQDQENSLFGLAAVFLDPDPDLDLDLDSSEMRFSLAPANSIAWAATAPYSFPDKQILARPPGALLGA